MLTVGACTGNMLRSILILAALSALSIVHANIYKTRFKGTTWDDENWTITTTDLVQGQYQSRMSLANGYLGINLAAGTVLEPCHMVYLQLPI